ncbi:MAG: 4Fe-4S binding protein [Syntrophales bacterium]
MQRSVPSAPSTGKRNRWAYLHRDRCIRCKSCIRACKFKAIH